VKRLRVSAAAERDLDDIWYYIATHSGSAERANKFVDSITRRLSILTRSPTDGRVRDEIDFDLRLPVGDYVVYYRESARSIIISRIIHGSREQDVAYDDKLPQ
jgi:plasmid stabilization system protein ParE